jgi:hypothetical protein
MRLFIIVVIALIGCNTTKHYKKVATDTDVTLYKKAIIAPWVSVNFPNQTTFIAGQVDTVETLVWDEMILNEMNEIIDSLLMLPKDSVIKLLKEKCIPVTKTVYLTRVDTVQREDQAKVFVLQQSLARSEATIIKRDATILDKDAALSKVKNQRNTFIGISFLFVLSLVIFIYVKLKP